MGPFLATCVAVAGLSFANGGYFPPEWGAAILAFVLVAVAIVALVDVPQPGRLECAFVAGLASLAAWMALSSLWSPGAAAQVLEAERTVVYVAVAAATVLVLAAGAQPAALLGGVVAGTVVVSLYALATLVFPGRVGLVEERIAEPVGYSNALAILAVTGILLALGFTAHRSLAVRSAAAVALVILGPVLYLTFSRGGSLALAGGAVLLALLHPQRPRLIASALLLGAPAVVGVLLISRHARVWPVPSADAAEAAGRRLALILVAVALLALLTAAAVSVVEARVRLPPQAGRVLVVTAGVAVVAGGAVLAGAVAQRERSDAPLPADTDPGERMLSLTSSYRSDYWRVAWHMARAEPLSGTGAGSWEAHWVRERPIPYQTRDAHNLYLETLAELGVVGLTLLLATLALPFLALRSARLTAGGPAAGAAFAAVLLHAALDWDWEIPAVFAPALVCAAVLLGSTRPTTSPRLTGARRGLALACAAPLAAIALVAHAGNGAAQASANAGERGDARGALEEARRAIDWAPWSEQAWELRGEAELLLREDGAARASLRRALELNPESWSAWLDLAVASEGAERRRALERVTRLNPLSPEAEEVREALQTKR